MTYGFGDGNSAMTSTLSHVTVKSEPADDYHHPQHHPQAYGHQVNYAGDPRYYYNAHNASAHFYHYESNKEPIHSAAAVNQTQHYHYAAAGGHYADYMPPVASPPPGPAHADPSNQRLAACHAAHAAHAAHHPAVHFGATQHHLQQSQPPTTGLTGAPRVGSDPTPPSSAHHHPSAALSVKVKRGTVTSTSADQWPLWGIRASR